MAANDSVDGRPSATFSATCEVLEQREMLEHHADAERARLGRTGQHDLLPHPAQFAAARLDEAVHRLDQRRLAGAVLAEQGVNFGGIEIEIDVVVGEKSTVPLADGGAQQRLGSRGGARRRDIKHRDRCACPRAAGFGARIVPRRGRDPPGQVPSSDKMRADKSG